MYALKGQQHLAQGNALGNGFPLDYALKGQKLYSLALMLLPLQGVIQWESIPQGVALG